MLITFGELPEPSDVAWASGRLTTRTYASRSFDMAFGKGAGQKARYIHKVFDELASRHTLAAVFAAVVTGHVT